MDATIYVKDFSSTALSDNAGLELRKAVLETLQESDRVVIDFSGIAYYATPFFNSSIGFLINNLSPEVFEKRITVTNISPVGISAYNNSKQNAIEKYKLPSEKQEKVKDIMSTQQ